MDTDAPARSSPRRDLPPAVGAEVLRRRDEILARARERGPLLDLDEPGTLDQVMAASWPDRVVDDAHRYDTIVSTARLLELADLPAAVRGLRRLLADDGELHLVEPVNHVGPVAMVVGSLAALFPGLSRWHLNRDVVAAVRETDLTVVDLERFTVATEVWPLRRFVQARAILVTPMALDDPARGGPRPASPGPSTNPDASGPDPTEAEAEAP